MRIRDLIETASAGATASGSVASVAMPFFTNGTPAVIRRNDIPSRIKPKKSRKDVRKSDQA